MYSFWGRIISHLHLIWLTINIIMTVMLSRRLTRLIYSRYSSCARRIFHLQRIVPKTAVVGLDGVENGTFYATGGDDNFITAEAAAHGCRLRRIDNDIGRHLSTAELTCWMVVGNCGHSIGGHHGAGVNESKSDGLF